MNGILILSLVITTLLAFYLSNRDIAAPWPIVSALFLLSSCVAAANSEYWGFHAQPRTIAVLVTAVLVFGAGQTLAAYRLEKRSGIPGGKSVQTVRMYRPGKGVTVLVLAVMLALLVYYVRTVYLFSLEHGNTGGFGDMVYVAREAIVARYDISKLANHAGLFAKAIALVFTAIALQDFVYEGFRIRQIFYLLPFVLYVPFLIVIGERGGLIYLVEFVILAGAYFIQSRDGWSARNSFLIAGGALGAIVLFLVFFRVTGFLKGSGTTSSAFVYISKYSGFSIAGFDIFLDNGFPDAGIFGGYTLKSLYSITNQLGLTDVNYTFTYLPFTTLLKGTDSNVYTSLARYIQDYGYAGMYLIMLVSGAAYGWGWYRLRRNPDSMGGIILYAYLFFPIGFISIDDCLFGQLLTTTTVYQLIYLVIVWKLVRQFVPAVKKEWKIRR